ncbi:Ada metal-binding domain-containing protein [Syntrophomonas palmitatica]|uniref:Ada metal-binding domain-containing protein n=1 Tax=Syntrophomonas palmitatica TaxID=402877 RepID=UPI0006D262EC|nr:Ada metal-binding domain-containing protein [Syntrophomonas palmitatica]
MILCGAGNDYGHPHNETIERLQGAGAKIYRTDLNGSIRIYADGERIRVACDKDGPPVVAPIPAAPLIDRTQTDKGQTAYIGNKRSKIFHRPDCHSLPAEYNRIYFNCRDDAVDRGFRPCGSCRP